MNPPATTSIKDGVFTELYEELGELAAGLLQREGRDHTLPPAALVHEAWMRIGDRSSVVELDRPQFLAIAGRAMRQLLVDHARRKAAVKRGGNWSRISLSPGILGSEGDALDVLALEHALAKLGAEHERAARVVELRFFSGLEETEIAIELGISRTTVQTDWRFARAWLYRELADNAEHKP